MKQLHVPAAYTLLMNIIAYSERTLPPTMTCITLVIIVLWEVASVKLTGTSPQAPIHFYLNGQESQLKTYYSTPVFCLCSYTYIFLVGQPIIVPLSRRFLEDGRAPCRIPSAVKGL